MYRFLSVIIVDIKSLLLKVYEFFRCKYWHSILERSVDRRHGNGCHQTSVRITKPVYPYALDRLVSTALTGEFLRFLKLK